MTDEKEINVKETVGVERNPRVFTGDVCAVKDVADALDRQTEAIREQTRAIAALNDTLASFGVFSYGHRFLNIRGH